MFYTVEFVIYIYCAWVIIPLQLNYTVVCIYMFVHNIMVSELICLYILYNPIISCTSYWEFFYISPVHGLVYHCVVVTFAFVLICLWILNLCLLKCFCVIYMIYYLVLIHIGRLVVYITWFIIPLFTYSLNCIHNSGLTNICLDLLFIYHMNWNTCIRSYLLVSHRLV